jgi:hypothetical protein
MDDKPVNDVSFTAMYYENKWTTKPPTEPGMYYAKARNSAGYWVELKDVEGKIMIVAREWINYGWTDRFSDIPSHFTHWLGPLPVPKPLE